MGYQEEKQRQLDLRYLRMARIWAENSYCVRRKVGALIVKDKMIISDGYNGTPSGFENICEDEAGHTKSYVLHAEANAITKVAKSANNCDGSTLYITAAPCIECSKLIIQAGIKRVVYSEEYRSEEGIRPRRSCGLTIEPAGHTQERAGVAMQRPLLSIAPADAAKRHNARGERRQNGKSSGSSAGTDGAAADDGCSAECGA